VSDPAKPHVDRRASDIGMWICEKHDGEKIPNPGIIVIGKLYAGMEAFNAPTGILVLCGLVAFAASQARSRLQYA
jgi:hypothetical protein